MRSKYSISLASLIIALWATTVVRPAQAAATPWVGGDYAQVRLIAAWKADTGLRAGLQFRLDAGWKTYWRSPGDSGIPTRIDWSGSRNVPTPVVRYPIPHRVESFGFQTLVYQDQIVLPVEFSDTGAGGKFLLRAKLDYAVCQDICVPLHADLKLEVDADVIPDAADEIYTRLIDRYAARVPSLAVRDDLALGAVALEGAPGQQTLNVVIATKSPMTAPGLIVEASAPFGFGAPTFSRQGAVTLAKIGISGGKSNKSLNGQRLTLTIYDGDVGIERVVVIDVPQ